MWCQYIDITQVKKKFPKLSWNSLWVVWKKKNRFIKIYFSLLYEMISLTPIKPRNKFLRLLNQSKLSMWNFCEFIHNRFFNVSRINRCNKSRESMFSTNSFRFVWPTFNCFTMSVLATVNDFKIENKNNCLWYWESTNNFPPGHKKEERKTQ